MKHKTSLTSQYAMHCDAVFGLKELTSNAIDADPKHPASFSYSERTHTLVITNEKVQLSLSALLLGTTTKRGDNQSIGTFGEGLPLALLSLLRAGHQVTIDTGESRWTPEFEAVKGDLTTLALVINERKVSWRSDLVVVVRSVPPELWEHVKSFYLYFISPKMNAWRLEKEASVAAYEEDSETRLFVFPDQSLPPGYYAAGVRYSVDQAGDEALLAYACPKSAVQGRDRNSVRLIRANVEDTPHELIRCYLQRAVQPDDGRSYRGFRGFDRVLFYPRTAFQLALVSEIRARLGWSDHIMPVRDNFWRGVPLNCRDPHYREVTEADARAHYLAAHLETPPEATAALNAAKQKQMQQRSFSADRPGDELIASVLRPLFPGSLIGLIEANEWDLITASTPAGGTALVSVGVPVDAHAKLDQLWRNHVFARMLTERYLTRKCAAAARDDTAALCLNTASIDDGVPF